MYCYDVFLRVTGVAYDIQDQGTEGLYCVTLSSNINYDIKNPGDRFAMQECARLCALYNMKLSNERDFYFDFYDSQGVSLDSLSEHPWIEVDYESMLENYEFQADFVGKVEPKAYFEGVYCKEMNYLFRGQTRVVRWVGEFVGSTVEIVEAQELVEEDWIALDDEAYYALATDAKDWLEEDVMFNFFLDYDTRFVSSVNLFEFED